MATSTADQIFNLAYMGFMLTAYILSYVEIHCVNISICIADPILGMLFQFNCTSTIKKDVGRKKKKGETNPQGSEIPLKVNTALAQELLISFCKCYPLFSGCKVQILSGRLAEHSDSRGGGWEEDNKATGEGHKAMEIVSGIAVLWVEA